MGESSGLISERKKKSALIDDIKASMMLMMKGEKQIQVIKIPTNPFIWFVVVFRAKTTSTSAKVLFPIQRFWPSSIQPPETCFHEGCCFVKN